MSQTPFMYRYVVVGPWANAKVVDIDPPMCFGLFITLAAAAAHMRDLGSRFSSVSVIDRSTHQYVAHLWQAEEAVVFDPIWPPLAALARQPDGSYREVIYAQNRDGSITEKV